MRRLLAAAALCALACAPKPDPNRIKLLNHLRDARPTARIVAIDQLAPHANREETAAIVRAAQDGSAEVRNAVVAALTKVDADNAVDLAAGFLRDPSDDVRATAVKTLVILGGPRAQSYISHAYVSGGPKMRAAIAASGEAVLAPSISVEATTLASDRQRRSKDVHEQIKEEAITDLGLSATPEAIAELVTRLTDAPAPLAGAACLGLAEAGATTQLPFVLQALKSGRPEVEQSCAFTVATLNPAHASDQLAPLVRTANRITAGVLLDRLSEVKLSDTALDALCHIALESPDGALALRAATLAAPHCTATGPYPTSWTQSDQLLVSAALKRKDPALLKEAHDLLGGKDAELASFAAKYIAACGTADDATLLMSEASAELHDMDFARAQIVQHADQKRLSETEERIEKDDQLRALLGDEKFAQYLKLQPPLRDKLLARLKRAPAPDVADEFEKRPGEIDLISACIEGAHELGADVTGLAAVIFDEKELRLRLLGLRLSNAGPGGEALRAQARKDGDPVIQRAQNTYDLQAGDDAAVERLAPLLSGAAVGERAEIAELLGNVAAKSVPAASTLIGMLRGDDDAVPVAAAGLAQVRTPEATTALLALLQDQKGAAAVASITALGDRPGANVDTALAAAAVHPMAVVREAALAALTVRHACGSAGTLKALDDDYVGAVRTAAKAFAAACTAAPASSAHP